MRGIKEGFILVSFFIILILFGGSVSAASLSVDEVGYGSASVVSHTVNNGNKVPGYVRVNGKNSTVLHF